MTPKLSAVIAAICDLRADLRARHAPDAEIATATEGVVKHFWAPFVTDERFWPDFHLRAVCAYCDGTGLVIHRGVTSRLGTVVDEGVPCRCPLGARFLVPVRADDDHTKAGKTPPKPRSFSRIGR